jgi:hypothetical protein
MSAAHARVLKTATRLFQREGIRAGDDPRARLLAPFAALESWFTSPGLHGCPFVNASLELHDPGHPATALATRHKAATRDLFATAAGAAGLGDAAAAALADQLAVLFDGAIAQAQMREPRAVARAALAAATTLVDAAGH